MDDQQKYLSYFEKANYAISNSGEMVIVKSEYQTKFILKQVEYGQYIEGIFRLTAAAKKDKKSLLEFVNKLNCSSKITTYFIRDEKPIGTYWMPYKMSFAVFRIVLEIFEYDIVVELTKIPGYEKILVTSS